MAFDATLAARIRKHLSAISDIKVEEKKMFGGLAFMINGKMCVNVSGKNLMCRFDPVLSGELAKKKGFLPVTMKGRLYKGYCYVEPAGFADEKDFEFWLNLCLTFNDRSKT